ncbi:hypothetical protein FUAX_01710 [Fulvitalea axinellae]|uniref:1-phosphatidylinositol phosphodiesterase n=1 Tax=Fulvitalea axinellae TaxID=1182444 RepID=A0AAU9C6W7_9BACT|nr:hypothetical protein FUAX_01710 [Fulvitalea axinellae]
MKKLNYFTAILAFLALFSSCDENNMEINDPSADSQPTFSQSVANLPAPSPTNKDIQFGLSTEFDGNSYQSDVGMDKNGNIVEVHQSRSSYTIWYHTGKIKGNHIEWSSSRKYDTGRVPSVDLNDNGTVVEVHKTSSIFTNSLWYRVGRFSGNSVQWGDSHKYDSGSDPVVSVNNSGDVVEVHKSQSNLGLWARSGKVNTGNGTISWNRNSKYDTGKNPSIAVNDNGLVVEVHESETKGTLYYHIGRLSSSDISWGPSRFYQTGSSPSVALLNDGTLVETHRSEGLKNSLWRMVGKVNGDAIEWTSGSEYFDDGQNPSVAFNGEYAVQTHQSQDLAGGIWASAGLFTDHGNWMRDLLPIIGGRTLGQVVMPGSHDAGMYETSLGQTQDKNLYEQLKAGVRFFDLRPNADMEIYHGPVTGPSVDATLNDVRKFMDEGAQELVILKFSHFKDFNGNVYANLKAKIKSALSPYFFEKPTGARLADLTMNDFLEEGGKVLILCDGNFSIDAPETGIYTYRDWQSGDPQAGDLVVFDRYSNTTDYNAMKNDQLAKFRDYNGRSQNGKADCDMFLLSWTLTPVTYVWGYSRPANANLAVEMDKIQPNANGFIPNILYTDFVQLSKATDASILLNKRL